MSKTTIKKTPNARAESIRFVLLDLDDQWLDRFGRSQSLRCDDLDTMTAAMTRSRNKTLWISSSSKMTENLLSAVSRFTLLQQHAHRPLGDLLMLRASRISAIPSLHGWFRRMIGGVPSFKLLDTAQLAQVLLSEKKSDLFLGGIVDEQTGTMALVRGNLETLTIPLSLFKRSGTAKPDFSRFDLDDYGQTITFGEYEASADAVLYEAAPDYRKRLNAKRRVEDVGFGASLRRLRKQKALSRRDFPGIAEKTIARIERGEVDKPHGKTLETIASVMGVAPQEIETY